MEKYFQAQEEMVAKQILFYPLTCLPQIIILVLLLLNISKGKLLLLFFFGKQFIF